MDPITEGLKKDLQVTQQDANLDGTKKALGWKEAIHGDLVYVIIRICLLG